jgi:hypothetical protein
MTEGFPHHLFVGVWGVAARVELATRLAGCDFAKVVKLFL